MLNFCFVTSKRHILARNRVVWRILLENRFRGLGCGPLEEPGKKEAEFWCAISRKPGKETPWGIVTKFCTWVDIRDVITYATFDDDRLRGLGVARGRISHFPIDLRRRPYNTLILPRQCVMIWLFSLFLFSFYWHLPFSSELRLLFLKPIFRTFQGLHSTPPNLRVVQQNQSTRRNRTTACLCLPASHQ